MSHFPNAPADTTVPVRDSPTPDSPTPDSQSSPAPSPESLSREPWVVVAEIVRPQGRHGEVLAELRTDFPHRFAAGTPFHLRSGNRTPIPVISAGYFLHKGRVVLHFSGIDSIEAAEKLRGCEVLVPLGQRMPLEEGAAYISDLVGCRLFDGDSGEAAPTEVGIIVGVLPQPATASLLVLRDHAGHEHLVPFVQAWLREMNLEQRRLVLTLPAGLLDLNAPLTPEEREQMRVETAGNQS